MKTLLTAAAWGFLLGGGLQAVPFYQINFTGTITSGSASGLNPAISNNSQTPFADLTGMHVSGWLRFDLGVAPLPTVTTDAGGFVTTAIQTTTLPVYITQSFVIDGLTVPPGFFPVPTVFDQPAVPVVPGSTVTVMNSGQALSVSARDDVSAASIVGGLNFQTSWSGGRFSGGSVLNFDVLINRIPAFFAIPPAGSFPDNWGPVAVGGNGVFGFGNLSADSSIPANFGMTEWYFVNGNFNVESASGAFVTPEPSNLLLTAVVFLLFAVRRSILAAAGF